MGKRLMILVCLLLFGISVSEAQLYVGKACLVNPNDPLPSTGTGTGTGGTAAPSSCNERTYFFEATNARVDDYRWDFGDGTVSAFQPRNPTHAYTTPGTYTVTVTGISGTVGTTIVAGPYSKQVKVGYYPNQPLFDKKIEKDTTICKGKTITLDPYKGRTAPPNVSYKWFPGGEISQEIQVSEAGCYSVEVIDNDTKCSRSAKINVKLCFEESSSGGGSERWYFGNGSGLEFTLTGDEIVQDSLADDGSLAPQPEIQNPSFDPGNLAVNEMRADEAAAMVFDKNNNLVFYTDGKKLYSGEGNAEIPLVGGGTFNISKNVGAQGVALVPKPVCSACDFVNYYLFTVDETTGLLSYSVIDMRENNRLGAVVETDVPVAVSMSGKIIAERSGDDLSYFITAYNSTTGSFESVTVDSMGIVSTPQAMPILQPGTTSEGYVAISADGNQLAHGLVINGRNQVQIVTRDPETNQLSAPRLIDLQAQAPPTVYGLAFSPNGNYLYVTLKGNGSTIESKLLQVDIATGGIVEIGSSMQEFGALGLGPKYGAGARQIYLTINNNSSIHYLQSPDEAGRNAVGFTLNSSNPGTSVAGTPKLGFPNVVAAKPEQEGQSLGANYQGNCLNAPTTLTAQQICDPMKNEFEWEVEGKKYTGETAVHYFSKTGWHNVKLTIKVYRQTQLGSGLGNATGGVTGNLGNDHCTTETFEGKIYIKPSPLVKVADPLYVCTEPPYNGKTVIPEVSGGNSFTYFWRDGGGNPLGPPHHDPTEAAQTFYTDQSFTVEVTNDYNCMTPKTFRLEKGCEPIVYAPNTFTPNGDGVNETFKLLYHFIDRPKLEIYNRWGEQVFQTDNLDHEWDGRFKQQLFANQLYAYVLRYYARDFPQLGEQRKTGSVLILTGK